MTVNMPGMFTTMVKSDTLPVLTGRRVRLRSPDLVDYDEWHQVRETSRAFLTPWEPTWTSFELTKSAFKTRLKRYAKETRDGTAYHFFLFDADSHALVGGLNLNGVRRGVTQSATIGYWTGVDFAGQGYMSDAVRAVIPFVFDYLKLNRLEAACIPENDRSRNLLLHAGFTEEGYARDYLRIDGRWRDHVLFGMTFRDYQDTFQRVLEEELEDDPFPRFIPGPLSGD